MTSPSKGFSRPEAECSRCLATLAEVRMLGFMFIRQEAYDALLRAYDTVVSEANESRRIAGELMVVAARKDAMLAGASENIDWLMGKMFIAEEYADRLRRKLPWSTFDRRDWLRRWEGKRLYCFHCGRRERMPYGVLCEPCVNALEEYSEVAFAEDMAEGRP